jgi:hypothetical protein
MTALLDLSPLLVTYSDNECAKELLYALDDHVWDMKITALEELADFATLDTEKFFSNLKSHELSHKGRPDHDASHTSKAFITSAHVGDTTHFIADCPKRKKLDSSNKYVYTKRNDYSKGDNKKKYHFRDKKKKF